MNTIEQKANKKIQTKINNARFALETILDDIDDETFQGTRDAELAQILTEMSASLLKYLAVKGFFKRDRS